MKALRHVCVCVCMRNESEQKRETACLDQITQNLVRARIYLHIDLPMRASKISFTYSSCTQGKGGGNVWSPPKVANCSRFSSRASIGSLPPHPRPKSHTIVCCI